MMEDSIGQPIVSSVTLDAALDDLLDILVEEEVSDIVNERGYDCYFGIEEEEVIDMEKVEPDLVSVNQPNVDIFGQVLGKKATFEIQCPNCKRTLAAVRFAPHLEKCMGMGRNSSRIASRRLAASAGNNSSSSFTSSETSRVSPGPTNGSAISTVIQTSNADIASEDDHFEDVDDDEDWTMEKKRKGRRAVEKTPSKRKGNGRSRKNLEAKSKRAASPSASPTSSIDPGDEASNFSTASSH